MYIDTRLLIGVYLGVECSMSSGQRGICVDTTVVETSGTLLVVVTRSFTWFSDRQTTLVV